MNLIKVTAKRVKEQTGIYKGFHRTEVFNASGELFATFPAGHTQPRKNKKVITINCFKYALSWI